MPTCASRVTILTPTDPARSSGTNWRTFATRQLADLGARVLKVERPGEGDFARHYDSAVGGSSAFFVWANRGKQSIELDLNEPGDRALFDRLVAGADVFVQNLSPAAAGRVAHSFVRDPLALWHHDQLRARDRFMRVSTPTGSAEVYKPPFNVSDAGDPDTTVPALGEHDPDLVAELEARAASRQASGS